MTDETLIEIEPFIEEFAHFLQERLDNALKNGEVEEREIDEEIFGWKLNDFSYSLEDGISSSGASSEQMVIKDKVFLHDIDKKIMSAPEYRLLINEILKRGGSEDVERRTLNFVRKFCFSYLRTKIFPRNIVSSFVKEVGMEPLKMWAKVELVGFTLEPESVQINPEVRIRRPTKEDLENKQKIFIFYNRDSLSLEYPSAILEIEIFGKNIIELQEYIEKSIILLRLFGSGGVKYLRYTLSSEAINFPGGISTPLEKVKPKERYILYKKDVDKLKKFWESISKIFGSGFDQNKFLNFYPSLSFSYQRYSEAILSNDIIEKKIVNAISGLESLYLNSSQELSRYLRLNVSKIMGLFGEDPYKIRDQIKDSYNIRSVFIHGNILGYESKKKYITKYGSLDKLFLYLINCLRISILIMIGLKLEKDEFIDLLEDAFIDKDKETLLREKIFQIKNDFGL